jgi:5'-nucleotidase
MNSCTQVLFSSLFALQVSGISFSFDPSKPPGQRVVADHVKVGDQPLQLEVTYRLATKAYLAEGKDGYTMLEDCSVLRDSETCPLLPTVMRRFFMILDVSAGHLLM